MAITAHAVQANIMGRIRKRIIDSYVVVCDDIYTIKDYKCASHFNLSFKLHQLNVLFVP